MLTDPLGQQKRMNHEVFMIDRGLKICVIQVFDCISNFVCASCILKLSYIWFWYCNDEAAAAAVWKQ